jgi:hypothetical protein
MWLYFLVHSPLSLLYLMLNVLCHNARACRSTGGAPRAASGPSWRSMHKECSGRISLSRLPHYPSELGIENCGAGLFTQLLIQGSGVIQQTRNPITLGPVGQCVPLEEEYSIHFVELGDGTEPCSNSHSGKSRQLDTL